MSSSGGNVDDIHWRQLDEKARKAMEWAAAMEEVSEVGTRTLLLGMIRTEGRSSPPRELLDAFDCSLEELCTLLQDMAPMPRIRPRIGEPVDLDRFPILSPNAALVREVATGLRDRLESKAPVDNRHFFAAILDNASCTAYQALALILKDKVEIESVRHLYFRQLEEGDSARFSARLKELFPVDRSMSTDSGLEPSGQGSIREELSGHLGPVIALSFAPDGESLASGGADGVVRVWDLTGGRAPLVIQKEEPTPVSALVHSRDGTHLVGGYADGSVTVLALGDKAKGHQRVRGIEEEVRAAAVSWDGTLAIGERSGRISIWSPDRQLSSSSFDHGSSQWDVEA